MFAQLGFDFCNYLLLLHMCVFIKGVKLRSRLLVVLLIENFFIKVQLEDAFVEDIDLLSHSRHYF